MLTVHNQNVRLAKIESTLSTTSNHWRKCHAISGKLFHAGQTNIAAIRDEWLVDACVAMDNLEASLL